MKTREVVQYISDWLADYARDSEAKGFVVGVSGGIDSAVTSTLAARTGLPLLCVEMPIHQGVSQVARAKDHMAFLKDRYPNTRSHEVELTEVFDQLIRALPESEETPERERSLVNARARVRMTTLYYFAALYDYLVLGTGNKVEDFGIGFFTKYGDGGVDLSPIGDLSKSEVYKLGEELCIIDSVMKAPPTDGLWLNNRTDEDQIGASYPELEWAMEFRGDESKLGGRQREVLQIYRTYHKVNRHKMEPVPVCKIPGRLLYESAVSDAI
jgi:NAD+ synthase